jgi:hypothetical protein
MERISSLYAVSGIHGRISALAMNGVHLLVFIEEVERGRAEVSPAVRKAIHTLQSALNKRDNIADEKGQEQKERTTSEETTHSSDSRNATEKVA